MRPAKMLRQAMFSCIQMIVRSLPQLWRRGRTSLKLSLTPDLYRGDIRIKFDGMEISDVADLRADWQISQSISDENSGEIETAQTKISDVELETQTADNLSLDSQAASVQSNIILPRLKMLKMESHWIDENEGNEGRFLVRGSNWFDAAYHYRWR